MPHLPGNLKPLPEDLHTAAEELFRDAGYSIVDETRYVPAIERLLERVDVVPCPCCQFEDFDALVQAELQRKPN